MCCDGGPQVWPNVLLFLCEADQRLDLDTNWPFTYSSVTTTILVTVLLLLLDPELLIVLQGEESQSLH